MSETTRYTVAGLGGVEVTALPLDDDVRLVAIGRDDGGEDVPVTLVEIPEVGPAYLPTAALEPARPPLPAEPPVGAVVLDRYDLAWQHGERRWYSRAGHGCKWDELQERGPLFRMVAVGPVDLPFEIIDRDDDRATVTLSQRDGKPIISLRVCVGGVDLTPDGARRYANAVLHAADLADAAAAEAVS